MTEREIINYEPIYVREIDDLFHGSAHKIASSHYTREEIGAWAPTPPDYEKWSRRLNDNRPYLTVQGSKVLRFI